VDSSTTPGERRAFNEQYQAPIHGVAGVSWLLLSVFGILPGTGRFKRNPLENEVKESQLVASVYQNLPLKETDRTRAE
jgi:hypothetical protein